MNTAITVDLLANFVQDMQKRGFGKKKILISTDDEGNDYHELFYGFTPDMKMMTSFEHGPFFAGIPRETLIKDYIILG